MSKKRRRKRQRRGQPGAVIGFERRNASFFTPLHSSPVPYRFTLPISPEKEYWLWQAIDTHAGISQRNIAELRDWGWQPLDVEVEKEAVHLLLICSQLGRVLTIYKQGSATPTYWAKSSDIRHAVQYPALLLFEAPLDADRAFIFDNLVVGTLALVYHDEEVGRFYTLDQLPETAKDLWQRVSEGLYPPDFIGDLTRNQLHAHKRKNEALWERAHLAAQELAALYCQAHQDAIKRPTKRTLPEVPDVFRSGKAQVSAPLAIRGVLRAYTDAQRDAFEWKLVDRKPTYTYQYDRRNAVRIQLCPPSMKDAVVDDEAAEGLWNRLETFSDLDADVLLAMLAQWTAGPRDAEGCTWITTEQLLKYRSVQPRKRPAGDAVQTGGAYRQKYILAIASSVARLRDTRLALQQMLKEDSGGRRGRRRVYPFERESELIKIVETIPEREVDPKEADTPADVSPDLAWRYRPGAWHEPFDAEPNRRLIWLLKQVLEYDPYHESCEKRLACLLAFEVGQAHTNSIILSVGTLVDEARITLRTSQERIRARFEKALDSLRTHKYIAAWHYVEDPSKLPATRWIQTWRSYSVEITLADPWAAASE